MLFVFLSRQLTTTVIMKKVAIFIGTPFRSPVQTATFAAIKKSGITATQKLPFAGLAGIVTIGYADSVRFTSWVNNLNNTCPPASSMRTERLSLYPLRHSRCLVVHIPDEDFRYRVGAA